MSDNPTLTLTAGRYTAVQQLQEFPDLPDEEARVLLATAMIAAADAARQKLFQHAESRIKHAARVEIRKHLDALVDSEVANDKALDEAVTTRPPAV